MHAHTGSVFGEISDQAATPTKLRTLFPMSGGTQHTGPKRKVSLNKAFFGNSIAYKLHFDKLLTKTEPIDMDVRSATLGDIDALTDLMEVFYAESDMVLDRQWAETSFTTLLSQPRLGSAWLADASGVDIGYAVLTVRHSMEFGGLVGYIDDLFVRAASRRLGTGSALLTRAMDVCTKQGCRTMQIEVGQSNLPALGLYRKLGFESVDDDRVILFRELGD